MTEKIRNGIIAVLSGILVACLIYNIYRQNNEREIQHIQANPKTFDDYQKENKVNLKKIYEVMVILETGVDLSKVSREDIVNYLIATDEDRRAAIELYGKKKKKTITPPKRIILEYD